MSQAAARFLEAYDAQLRTDAEIPGALTVHGHGPLVLATFVGGRGFITYRDLGGADHEGIQALVAEALNFFRRQPHITNVEWKSRGHDHAPGLHDALVANGFAADEPESIMIGEARALSAEVPVPDGVTLRRVVEEPDVRAMSAMQDGVFGDRCRRNEPTNCCTAFPWTTASSCGSLKPRAGWSAPDGWNPFRVRTLPESGAEPPSRNGEAAGSTGLSLRDVHSRPLPVERRSSTATRRSSHVRSWSVRV